MSDRVVVCTPTFHRPALLRAAIESVLNQTYRDVEHIAVQDGCGKRPDCPLCKETEAIGAEYAGKDSRFRFIALDEHKGGYGFYARNHAIEISKAPLIAYLDDDNWWEPNHLELLVDALNRERASFAFSGTLVRGAGGKVIHHRISRQPYFMGIDTNELLHRRELFAQYGPWKPTDDATHNHDWELVSRWLRGGEKYAASGQATSNYQLNPRHSALRYFYAFAKRRAFYGLSRVFLTEDQRLRARTRTTQHES